MCVWTHTTICKPLPSTSVLPIEGDFPAGSRSCNTFDDLWRTFVKMESIVPYFYKAVDSASDALAPYLTAHQLDQLDHACLWMKENDRTVLYSTLGAVVLGGLFLLGGSGGKGRRRKKGHKKFKLKIKPAPPKVKLDPMQSIDAVLKKLEAELVPQVDRLDADVATGSGAGGEKVPYKETSHYRRMYLQETLLRELISLDGVEGEGAEEYVQKVRAARKAAVKAVQVQLARLDRIPVQQEEEE